MATHTEPEVREAAFERAGHRCERCYSTSWLELHHVLGRVPDIMVNEPANLTVLCRDCHAWWHGHKPAGLDWFVEKFGNDRLERLLELRRGVKRVVRRFAESS